MSAHTPGPWEWATDRFRGGYSGLFGPSDVPIIVPQCANDGDTGAAWFDTSGDAGDESITDANARLIAAAPDMYEALKALFYGDMEKCMLMDGKEDQIEAIAKARAALAKAGGQ